MAKINQQFILQFNGREFDLSAVEANVKKSWKEAGHKLTEIADMENASRIAHEKNGFTPSPLKELAELQ